MALQVPNVGQPQSPNGSLTPSVVIGFGNLANAAADETIEQYRFGVREAAIHQAIKSLKTDVFAASELRICQNKDKTSQLQPAQLATRLASGTNMTLADCRPQNLDPMAFWRATLMNEKTVEMVVSGSEWAIPPVFGSTKIEERGVMLMFTQFRVAKSKLLFWVINSHMPMATTEKLKTIDWLNANAEKRCKERWNDPSPIIFYGGDQNTFFDRDGHEMMKRFSEKWTHVTSDIKETFVPFPHDKVQIVSVLDHIFINTSAADRVKIQSVAAHDTKVSDHFFLTVSVSFL